MDDMILLVLCEEEKGNMAKYHMMGVSFINP